MVEGAAHDGFTAKPHPLPPAHMQAPLANPPPAGRLLPPRGSSGAQPNRSRIAAVNGVSTPRASSTTQAAA